MMAEYYYHNGVEKNVREGNTVNGKAKNFQRQWFTL